MIRRSLYSALLIDRQNQQKVREASPLAKCEPCRAGNHRACRTNRTYDRATNSWTDCYCHFSDHGVRPSDRMNGQGQDND